MLNQQNPEVRHLYALIYGGFYSEAIKILDQFIKIDPEEPRWLAEKLGLLADTLRWTEFSPLQNRLLIEFPDTAESKLAEALMPGGSAVQRVKLLNQAIHLDADFSKLFYYRGLVFRMLNMNREALRDFDQCLVLAPGHFDVYLWRAKTYKAVGCYNKAIQDLMFYFNLPVCNQRGPIYEELIRLLQEMKKLDAAFDSVTDKLLPLMIDGQENALDEDPNGNQLEHHNKEEGEQDNESKSEEGEPDVD